MPKISLQPKNWIDVNRHVKNPILVASEVQPSDPDFEVVGVFNPGVFEFQGKVWLLSRVAERPYQTKESISTAVLGKGKIKKKVFPRTDPDVNISDPRYIHVREEFYLSTLSHLRLFCSEDGINFQQPGKKYLHKIFGSGPCEVYGIEDSRVTKIGDKFFITYTQVSPLGASCGLIETSDWQSITRYGTIFLPPNKDCALFEEKIDSRYLCLNRPSSHRPGGHFIWISSSPDLKYWGDHHCLLKTRPGCWDEQRVGAGAAPIKTEAGWLLIYHGANQQGKYSLGAALLDLSNPYKVLGRSRFPVMQPETGYEKNGFFSDVIFTNGHVVRGDEIWMYYGSSDDSICLAKLSIKALLSSLTSSTS